jgi:hypothetical protein
MELRTITRSAAVKPRQLFGYRMSCDANPFTTLSRNFMKRALQFR